MIKVLTFIMIFLFSSFSFAFDSNEIQKIESCPKETPILGYTECYACSDSRSLHQIYPDDNLTDYKDKYRERCKNVCPNRIEYCGLGWLGEGECFCELDTLKNRISALFFSNILEFFFGGWILFVFYLIVSIRFFYVQKFWKNKFYQIICSFGLPIFILFIWGVIFIGRYIFTFMAFTILIEWILGKFRKQSGSKLLKK